ncbi:MAG TPA: 50S ribosomal protein L23 [Firmicutes bacterium]|uniref:Large ribosomal subunit protein uL23 n=1 Tax=Candidatus Fermentithermobacillus carboniphilus TaxID=3085328 RepID=A0AAT9LBL1_9FIRM|nr:MAG: 50S ribosomal protein L23 [Candidatus Fermentithermobacillus carboniphilus]HHW18384.1 50S ribosomal protein L23 [Candidatus Fermentithermobacillaceae bacterium]
MNLSPRDIIIEPLVTEKTHKAMERGTYTFRVHPLATKADIHNAVEEIFKVKVVKVNTANVKGKPRRMGLHVGRTPGWKKAMVTLAPGQRIQFFEGV